MEDSHFLLESTVSVFSWLLATTKP